MAFRRGPTAPRKSTKLKPKSVGGKVALIRKIEAAKNHDTLLDIEVYKLKAKTHPSDLFALFPKIFADGKILERIHGQAFPGAPADIFNRAPIYKPANPLIELIWSLCRAIQNGSKLKKFNAERKLFEKAFIEGSQETAQSTLQGVEREFGWSAWLIQAKLSSFQCWEGIEVGRRYLIELEAAGLSVVPKFITTYVAKRIEATGLQKHLRDELRDRAKLEGNLTFEQYAVSKVFDMWDVNTENVAPILFYDAQFSQIDHYESLIAVLQSAASDQTIPEDLAAYLEAPLRTLLEKTDDERLLGIMLSLGFGVEYRLEKDKERAELVEFYSRGQYEKVVNGCVQYFSRSSDDIAMHLLEVKARVNLGIPASMSETTLGKIKQNYQKILEIGDEFYPAAYDLVTTLERFSGQSWINYLRAAVQLELRDDEGKFPPVYMRDMYVRDTFLTPFTRVIARGKALRMLAQSDEFHAVFPFTNQVYKATVEGLDTTAIDDDRLHYYAAINALNSLDYDRATRGFLAVLKNAKGITKVRAINGAVLAHIGNGRLEDAAGLLVASFIENNNAASLLPLKALVNKLEDPDVWPAGIEIPLVFELYYSYIDSNKLQHLRLAFERFQIDNGYNEPQELVIRKEVPPELIIEYLKRVWQPDVMLQTILYKGTKQIEDARIKVCKLLSELDSSNATKYLSEVRDRVKAQEIARGTILVESSKVYVDVEAIRAVLNKRLRDSYSRYKANIQDKENPLIYSLSNALQDIHKNDSPSLQDVMAALHLLDVPDSEANEQFAAIFLEVTQEFLRGDYGLNAYLSTRVRHGKLVNTLRKPSSEEGLVTSRTQDGKSYLESERWRGEDSETEVEWKKIRQRLESFAIQFDGTVEFVRDRLIQIRIQKDLKAESSEALFVYPSSNIERMYFQEIDKQSSSVDELIAMCVEMLWRKTDNNLLRVQSVLNERIRSELRVCFDSLTTDLTEQFGHVVGINELLNAVSRARTETNKMLSHVVTWFKRNEVYDRQDYLPEFAVQISQNMLTRTIANLDAWHGVSVNSDSDAKMPGRTLDSVVEIYDCLLENALKHSALHPDELVISVDTEFKSGLFKSTVTSNLSLLIDVDGLERQLDGIRSKLELKESSILAQTDKGSGLHKISRAVNAPGFENSKFTFGIQEDKFVVNVSFELEAALENTIH